jgi:hypothetical protein
MGQYHQAAGMRPFIIELGLGSESELDGLFKEALAHLEDPDVIIVPGVNFFYSYRGRSYTLDDLDSQRSGPGLVYLVPSDPSNGSLRARANPTRRPSTDSLLTNELRVRPDGPLPGLRRRLIFRPGLTTHRYRYRRAVSLGLEARPAESRRRPSRPPRGSTRPGGPSKRQECGPRQIPHPPDDRSISPNLSLT